MSFNTFSGFNPFSANNQKENAIFTLQPFLTTRNSLTYKYDVLTINITDVSVTPVTSVNYDVDSTNKLIRINGLSDNTSYTINIVTTKNNYNVTGNTLDTGYNYLHLYYNFVDVINNNTTTNTYKNMVDNSYNLVVYDSSTSTSTDLNGLPSKYNASNFKYYEKTNDSNTVFTYNVLELVNEISVCMWAIVNNSVASYDFNIVENALGHKFRIVIKLTNLIVRIDSPDGLSTYIYNITDESIYNFTNWTHICVTVPSNGLFKIYKNGTLIFTSTKIVTSAYFFNNKIWNTDYSKNTKIGPIMIFSTCLTATQVSNIYNG
jgi:hypothetical protein